MKTTTRVALATSLFVLTFGASEARASIPAADGTYTGCTFRGFGTLRLIDVSIPSQRCLAGIETQVTWNKTGPQGPPGLAGPAGASGLNGTNVTATAIDPITDSRCGFQGGVAIFQDGVSKGIICSIQGPAGIQGAQGLQGLPGATGALGPQGPTGPTGPTGPPGPAAPAQPSPISVVANLQAGVNSSDTLFMLVPGVAGTSLDSKHFGWFDLTGFSTPAVDGVLMPPVMVVTRKADTKSVALLRLLASAASPGDVTIEVCRTSPYQECYVTYVLKSAVVTSMAVGSIASQPAFLEATSIRHSGLTVTYKMQNADGSLSGPILFDVPVSAASAAIQVQPVVLAGDTGPTTWPAFVKVAGLVGESFDSKHYQWSNSSGMRVAAVYRDGAPHFSGSFLKAFDRASFGLLSLAASGASAPLITSESCDPRSPGTCPLHVEMSGGSFSSVGVGADGSVDVFGLADATGVSLTFREQRADGTWGAAAVFSWP
jgi:hypothetical protein